MKMGKKSVMGISFMIGTLMFATTAFAEVSSKSGYEQAKDALKFSADSLSSKFQNYTINSSTIVKDNGTIISELDNVNKYDLSKHAVENTTNQTYNNKPKIQTYLYRDKNTNINYDNKKMVYYVSNFKNANNFEMFSNPFKAKQAGDVEEIADAAVGNLKDSMVVNVKADGTKELSGSISESQIPAIANAIVSYEIKSIYCTNNGNNSNIVFPNEISDVYVKDANEDIILNKDGLIQTATGSAQISCKDNQGKVHNLTFEELATVTDINTTKVNKPDLTGKNVQESTDEGSTDIGNPQMYVGTYKNDISIENNGKFVKIGERTLDITSIDSKKITGKYREEYIKGYENYSSDAKNINFTAKFEQPYNANFQIVDAKGSKLTGSIFLQPNQATIGFQFENNNDQSYNWSYYRVFN
jgi:hypothetical protein